MSFQRGFVRWQGIYRRRLKKQKAYMTASESIDPMPPHSSPRE